MDYDSSSLIELIRMQIIDHLTKVEQERLAMGLGLTYQVVDTEEKGNDDDEEEDSKKDGGQIQKAKPIKFTYVFLDERRTPSMTHLCSVMKKELKRKGVEFSDKFNSIGEMLGYFKALKKYKNVFVVIHSQTFVNLSKTIRSDSNFAERIKKLIIFADPIAGRIDMSDGLPIPVNKMGAAKSAEAIIKICKDFEQEVIALKMN